MTRLECSLSAVYVTSECGVVAYVPEIPEAHGQGASIEEARACLAESLNVILAASRTFTHQSFAGARILHREMIPPVQSTSGH